MGRIATGLDRDLLALRDLIRHRYPAETVEQQREIDGAIAMYQLASPDAATWGKERWDSWLQNLRHFKAMEASPDYDSSWDPGLQVMASGERQGDRYAPIDYSSNLFHSGQPNVFGPNHELGFMYPGQNDGSLERPPYGDVYWSSPLHRNWDRIDVNPGYYPSDWDMGARLEYNRYRSALIPWIAEDRHPSVARLVEDQQRQASLWTPEDEIPF